MADTQVEVVVQIGGEDVLAGRLYSHRDGRAESATFSYEASYIERADSYELDPALPLLVGQQQTRNEAAIFGAFSDCAPDRWGRRLIERAEVRRAKQERQANRNFGEIDYLLGVRDDLRQGALRFRLPGSGIYLADERRGVPDPIELGKLLTAAERLEREEASEEELRALLRGGSSLGGARPKAHVIGALGKLAIAKFPSPKDDHEVIAWEAVTIALAREAGIAVSDWALEPIDGKRVLIVDRFDRVGDRRIGYVSAMTMLEARDGDRASYLDIADVVERVSPRTARDLAELWRRVAFTVLVSNTDDHLRNHGFLRTSSDGWSLAPAFDLNPSPEGSARLSTAIAFDDPTASIETLVEVAEHFRLDVAKCQSILGEVLVATAAWRQQARKVGLGAGAIEDMGLAFEHEQRRLAAEFVNTGPAAFG
jgi:serine/threonine-protein kinase HipA